MTIKESHVCRVLAMARYPESLVQPQKHREVCTHRLHLADAETEPQYHPVVAPRQPAGSRAP